VLSERKDSVFLENKQEGKGIVRAGVIQVPMKFVLNSSMTPTVNNALSYQ
jgi:hypothetical protein